MTTDVRFWRTVLPLTNEANLQVARRHPSTTSSPGRRHDHPRSSPRAAGPPQSRRLASDRPSGRKRERGAGRSRGPAARLRKTRGPGSVPGPGQAPGSRGRPAAGRGQAPAPLRPAPRRRCRRGGRPARRARAGEEQGRPAATQPGRRGGEGRGADSRCPRPHRYLGEHFLELALGHRHGGRPLLRPTAAAATHRPGPSQPPLHKNRKRPRAPASGSTARFRPAVTPLPRGPGPARRWQRRVGAGRAESRGPRREGGQRAAEGGRAGGRAEGRARPLPFGSGRCPGGSSSARQPLPTVPVPVPQRRHALAVLGVIENTSQHV